MSKVVRTDIDQQSAVITVTIEQADYQPRFESELSQYRKKAHLKGFRKGKTPESVVRKMYGKAVLAEVVNEMIQKELFDYLTRENLQILGQPLPSQDQEAIEFDLKHPEDYVFKFDVGLVPPFELQGLTPETEFEKYTVDISDEMVETELTHLRKRRGERIEVEGEPREGDLLTLKVRELEGGKVKENGVDNEFSTLLSDDLTEAARKEVQEKKPGDVFHWNLFELEKDKDEKFVRRYFFGLTEDDDRSVNPDFEVTIAEISRVQDAEMDQEFFDQSFGPDIVHNEEEAREEIRKNIFMHYDQQADALLFRDFQEHLMAQNPIPLPDSFLKRWIKASNEKATDEAIEREYEPFTKNLTWSILKNKLVRQFEIQVTEEELTEHFKSRIRGYFGGSSSVSDDLINSMAARLMQDEKQTEQAYEDLLTDKLHEAITGVVKITPKPTGIEELEAILQQARLEASAARNGNLPEEEE